jgi:hypothetical protein
MFLRNSLTAYQATLYHYAEVHNLNVHHRKNVKSHAELSTVKFDSTGATRTKSDYACIGLCFYPDQDVSINTFFF